MKCRDKSGGTGMGYPLENSAHFVSQVVENALPFLILTILVNQTSVESV
jgi:hypothetical protein